MRHRVQTDLENADFTSSFSGFKGPEGRVFGFGTTVGNGIEGWAPGAIFIDTNAAEFSLVYRNVGTKTTANFDVLGENAGEISVADANSNMTATTVEGVLDEHAKHIQSAQAFFPLPLGDFLDAETAAGKELLLFVGATATLPGYSHLDSESGGIRWNNHANPGDIMGSFPMPPDMDTSKDMIIHYMVSKTGATSGDTVSMTSTIGWQVDGALSNADTPVVDVSDAVTGNDTAKTVTELIATVAAADIPSGSSIMNILIHVTDGTLGTDDAILHGVWIEYTRKLLTS